MRRRMNAILLASASLSLTLAPTAPANAQFFGGIVYDPTNYAQNLLTAARTLTMINNQIKQLTNEAQMLVNQAKDLANLPYTARAALTTRLTEIETLIKTAKGLSYQVTSIDASFKALFPEDYAAFTNAAMAADARTHWVEASRAFHDALLMQAKIAETISSDMTTLDEVVRTSETAIGGLLWQGARSIVTPYVVEVDQTGTVRAIGPATESYKPSDAQIAQILANFIRDVRSVSIDPVVVRDNWLRAYEYATDRGAIALNDYARENDPFDEIGRRSVAVEIASVVRASADSFELRWSEKTYANGQFEKLDRYTAHLTIVVAPPRTAESLNKNPLGLYVHGINWSKDLSTGAPS